MPIHYNGKDYEFGELVEHIKRTKPGIKSPGGYVKSIEQNQHLGQKIAALNGKNYYNSLHPDKKRNIISSFTGIKPEHVDPSLEYEDLDKYTRKGVDMLSRQKDAGDRPPAEDLEETAEEYAVKQYKLRGIKRPPTPTQKDRTKIIQARLADLREEITEKKIAVAHMHRIEWHENPIGVMKVASLVDATGKFVKYWLLNAKEINGNGWGVSPISIAQNIKKFKGKPFVVTAQTWIEDSEYGMEFRHPTIMSNDLGTIFRYQAKYAVGLIRDVYEEKENWFATVEMSPKYAHLSLPPFCSPAIFQLDPFEEEGALTKWEALHLAGLFEKPAYGAQIALLKGTCIGTPNQCSVQFKGAQELKKNDLFKTALAGLNIQQAPNVKINPIHGRTIADAYDALKHNPNDQEVKQAYGALIHETNQQFKDLLKKGLKIDKIKHGIGAYANSEAMHRDITKNNHLYYFPTETGFGPGNAPKEHPMLQKTEFKHEEQPMLANDVFRIVHDVMGHHVGGRSDFSPEGEQQAFLTHKKMFSPLAQKALFTETAGQSNAINFSRAHGKQNRENPAKTVFPEQKAGIMPLHIINGRFHES